MTQGNRTNHSKRHTAENAPPEVRTPKLHHVRKAWLWVGDAWLQRRDVDEYEAAGFTVPKKER